MFAGILKQMKNSVSLLENVCFRSVTAKVQLSVAQG